MVVVVICAVAGGAAWFLYSPATEPKASARVTASAVTALATPVLPMKPAQVAAPVVTAVKVNPASSAKPPAAQPDAFLAQPQSDLKTCVATTAHFLETQDLLSLVKTIMPPDVMQRMIQSGQAASVEDIAEHYRQLPDVAGKMSQLQWALQNIQWQNQEPEMSADGTRATYKIDTAITRLGTPDAPPGTPGTITFAKVDGFWYLR
jgi:hypothetical protein